jgi:hypothetical protein
VPSLACHVGRGGLVAVGVQDVVARAAVEGVRARAVLEQVGAGAAGDGDRDADEDRGVVRIGFVRYHPLSDVDRAFSALATVMDDAARVPEARRLHDNDEL